MITTLIICATVIICLIIILLWAKDMATAGLPMFTYGECVKKESSDSTPVYPSMGFITVSDESENKEKTDKEKQEAYLKDPIALTASLLRGEVDIDDITN